jgi:hypothetical protein
MPTRAAPASMGELESYLADATVYQHGRWLLTDPASCQVFAGALERILWKQYAAIQ